MFAITVAGVVLAAVAGVGAYTLASRSTPAPPDPVPGPTSTSHPTHTTPPQTANPQPYTSSPADLLQAQARADQPSVESLVGWWVPQLSSKAPGLSADGIVYDDAAIWRHVTAARSADPSVLLLRSSDYSTFKIGGYWVLVAAHPFGTAAEANSWCAANGYALRDCFAKRLSHTDSPDGNSAPRG